MTNIPDRTETKAWIIQSTRKKRYVEAVEIPYAVADIRLQASEGGLSSYPGKYWKRDNCNFQNGRMNRAKQLTYVG